MAYEYREISREGSIDEKLVRHYTRVFQLITDNPNLAPGQACALIPINMFASWVAGTETDLTALLKKKSGRMTGQGDGGYFWEITCEYDSAPFGQQQGGSSSEQPSGDPAQSQTQPDMRPWTIEFGSVKTTKLLTKDIVTDAEVTASNGQPYDPAPEIPAFHPQINITAFKAIGADSMANVSVYTNKVNMGAWQGFADQTVLCTEYKLSSQYEHGSWWWQKQVTLEVNPDGPWNPIKILDAGTVTRVSQAQPFRPILDSTGQPVASPVPLNGFGEPLLAGAQLVYRDFNGYAKVNFANII